MLRPAAAFNEIQRRAIFEVACLLSASAVIAGIGLSVRRAAGAGAVRSPPPAHNLISELASAAASDSTDAAATVCVTARDQFPRLSRVPSTNVGNAAAIFRDG